MKCRLIEFPRPSSHSVSKFWLISEIGFSSSCLSTEIFPPRIMLTLLLLILLNIDGTCTVQVLKGTFIIIPHPHIAYARDTVVDVLVSYPKHVYTWEGYSNRSVSSCVCLCVCVCVST